MNDESVARVRRIAHDLNNALGAMMINAQLALDVLEPESPAREDLRELIESGEGAAKLTRELLELAREASR